MKKDWITVNAKNNTPTQALHDLSLWLSFEQIGTTLRKLEWEDFNWAPMDPGKISFGCAVMKQIKQYCRYYFLETFSISVLCCLLSLPSLEDELCFHTLVGFYFGMKSMGFGRKKRQCINEEGKPVLNTKSYQARVSKKLWSGDLVHATAMGTGLHPEWLLLFLEKAAELCYCVCVLVAPPWDAELFYSDIVHTTSSDLSVQ